MDLRTMKGLGVLVALVLTCMKGLGQREVMDTALCFHLAAAPREEFVHVAVDHGFRISEDTTIHVLLASKKDLVFAKPLKDTGTSYYYLALVVSTTVESNKKRMIERLHPLPGKTNTWTDNRYVYVEVDMPDPETHALWYKFLMYRIKN